MNSGFETTDSKQGPQGRKRSFDGRMPPPGGDPKAAQSDAPHDARSEDRTFKFGGLHSEAAEGEGGNLDFILDIPLAVTVELGSTRMFVNELLKLGQGSVIELSKLAGESLDVLANQRLIARGEVVVVNEKYGIRLTEITSPTERIERLG